MTNSITETNNSVSPAKVLKIVTSSLPLILAYMLDTTLQLISFSFVDEDIMVAAVGMGKMWMSCFTAALYFAIAAGFEVLAS